MTSFKVFGIKVDGTQTLPEFTNKSGLNDKIDSMLDKQTIHKVVVIKKWL